MKQSVKKSIRDLPDRPERRSFLAWNLGALLLALAGRLGLPARWSPRKQAGPGREARYYRKIE